jgi:hypothetical protein
MADHTNKEFAPVEASRELSKGLKDLIAKYESELLDLQERELKKNSAQLIPRGDAAPNMAIGKNSEEGYDVPGAEGMARGELPDAKSVRPGKQGVRTMEKCGPCGTTHEVGKHSKGYKKGEDYIDLKNQGDREKRLKGIGHATPNVIPKCKQVQPKNHAEGGNDGDNCKPNPLGKASVPMAKPPSGGTGLAPKAPSMAKPAAPAGGMPKPPMIAKGDRLHNGTGSAFPVSTNSTGSKQPNVADSELPMTKGGARMGNPKVEQGKPSLNTMAKAFGIPGRPGPGTATGDAASDAHKAAQVAVPAGAQAAPNQAKRPPVIPGRAQQLASFTPAGKFTGAGGALPQAPKQITLPGRAKPAVSAVNPAAQHLTPPPPAVRPPAAPIAKPAAPAQKPSSLATAIKTGHPVFGKSENFMESCPLCGKSEHPGSC